MEYKIYFNRITKDIDKSLGYSSRVFVMVKALMPESEARTYTTYNSHLKSKRDHTVLKHGKDPEK